MKTSLNTVLCSLHIKRSILWTRLSACCWRNQNLQSWLNSWKCGLGFVSFAAEVSITSRGKFELLGGLRLRSSTETLKTLNTEVHALICRFRQLKTFANSEQPVFHSWHWVWVFPSCLTLPKLWHLSLIRSTDGGWSLLPCLNFLSFLNEKKPVHPNLVLTAVLEEGGTYWVWVCSNTSAQDYCATWPPCLYSLYRCVSLGSKHCSAECRVFLGLLGCSLWWWRHGKVMQAEEARSVIQSWVKTSNHWRLLA